jgi:hypothetical protein
VEQELMLLQQHPGFSGVRVAFNKIFFQCFSGSVDYTAIYYKTLDQLLP